MEGRSRLDQWFFQLYDLSIMPAQPDPILGTCPMTLPRRRRMLSVSSTIRERKMTQAETFQLSVAAAEAYESSFVPALFGEWAPRVLDAAAVSPGEAVLDVACGTGVVAREAVRRVGPTGSVVGVDLNEAMVTVARRHVGPEAVDLLSSYWLMGNLDSVRGLFGEAGLHVRSTETHVGTARFDSVEQLVKIEVESTPLRDRIDEKTYDAILGDARSALAAFETEDGKAEVPIVGHIVTARR